MIDNSDTIAAVATAPGRSAVGMVRISGSGVPEMMPPLVGRVLAPRTACVVPFLSASGAPIDQGLALYFAAPASYTGEHVLELQGHGGPMVLRMVLQRCLELGARMAEPGEFTRRAFLNDKLDLAQAEGVADLIDAATVAAVRSALRSLRGVFSERVHALVRKLIDLRLLVEGAIDFPDEDIDFLRDADAAGQLAALRRGLDTLLEGARQGSLLREGARIVLIGQPNVGKSSLLNRLAGDDLAIVTDIPGTTRDVIRQAIDLDGVPAFIIDTAGLRESSDPVEQAGIARTWAAAADADLALLLVDARGGLSAADEGILRRLPASLPRIVVHNKVDLIGREPAVERGEGGIQVWLSAKDNAGVDKLRGVLTETLGWHGTEEGVVHARARHLAALEAARARLAVAAERGESLELYAEELRLAQEALSRITGEFTADDLLGEIFGRFCIGK